MVIFLLRTDQNSRRDYTGTSSTPSLIYMLSTRLDFSAAAGTALPSTTLAPSTPEGDGGPLP